MNAADFNTAYTLADHRETVESFRQAAFQRVERAQRALFTRPAGARARTPESLEVVDAMTAYEEWDLDVPRKSPR